MRKILVLVVAATIAGSGVAGAHGGRGSHEGDPKHRSAKKYQRNANNVRCAGGMPINAAGSRFYADPWYSGVEVCKDRGPAPAQGRVMASRSGWAAVDGDRHNPGATKGYVRVDRTGPHCSQGKDQDATHSRTRGKPTSCNGS